MFKLYGNYMFKYIFCLIWKDLFDFLRPFGSKRLLRRRALSEGHSSISGPLGPYNFYNFERSDPNLQNRLRFFMF